MAGVITHSVNDITPATFMECRIPWRVSSVNLDGRSDQGVEPVRVCLSILDLAGLVLEPDKTVESKCAGHLGLVTVGQDCEVEALVSGNKSSLLVDMLDTNAQCRCLDATEPQHRWRRPLSFTV